MLSDPARRADYDARLRGPVSTGPSDEPRVNVRFTGSGFHGGGRDDSFDPLDLSDPDEFSPLVAARTQRVGRLIVITMAIAAIALVALFVYAFLRSGTVVPNRG